MLPFLIAAGYLITFQHCQNSDKTSCVGKGTCGGGVGGVGFCYIKLRHGTSHNPPGTRTHMSKHVSFLWFFIYVCVLSSHIKGSLKAKYKLQPSSKTVVSPHVLLKLLHKSPLKCKNESISVFLQKARCALCTPVGLRNDWRLITVIRVGQHVSVPLWDLKGLNVSTGRLR